MSFSSSDLVSHPIYGQGTVLLSEKSTSVVRFSHGIESVLNLEICKIVSLAETLSSGRISASIELIFRIQADVISKINDTWGVFSRSRIKLLPHQLWVCHRALKNWPIRLIIADDVGMGKTVEAGLILWPLIAGRKIQRILILCPAKLVLQWQIRLKSMFDIRSATYHRELDSDRNDFWGIHPVVIASLPTLRANHKGRHHRILEAPAWDMLIVDEAHHLNADETCGKTLGYQLVEKLIKSGKVHSTIFFTGTPHRGKNYGFWSLMHLLDASVFNHRKEEAAMLKDLPRFLIRNVKQKASDMNGNRLFKPVHQYPETFNYTHEEETFYNLLSDFILAGKAYATSLHSGANAQVMLVLIALQKLASSSISAVRSALKTRYRKLKKKADSYTIENLNYNVAIEDPETTHSLETLILNEEMTRISLMNNEVYHLSKLIDSAEQVTYETRVSRIISIIKNRYPNESVLLFTEYKKTQALVINALISEFGKGSVGFINGDDRLENIVLGDGRFTTLTSNRETVSEAFNEGKIRYLVSTEAGGEGIDLQENCSTLIHIDLPWNPMRLHQRVGRLNRYGQKKAVEVISLRNPDTVESLIWTKLEQKLHHIMKALGTSMEEPEDLMQLILGMNDETFYDELFAEAKNIPMERLDQWFDKKTASLGGQTALQLVQDLVGHAAKFDLSDLKEIPPVDLPDIMPFFINSLWLNHKKPKVDGLSISFKTPESWMKSYSIKNSYENLFFDRSVPKTYDLMGVGHPLFEKSMQLSYSIHATASIVSGIEHPLMIFEIINIVTSQQNSPSRIIVGLHGPASDLVLKRDWEILKMLNKLTPKFEAITDQNITNKIEEWHRLASKSIEKKIDGMDINIDNKMIRESALFIPLTVI